VEASSGSPVAPINERMIVVALNKFYGLLASIKTQFSFAVVSPNALH
jgi:hypothetical protein